MIKENLAKSASVNKTIENLQNEMMQISLIIKNALKK